MRRRHYASLAILGLMIGGCGKPEILPLTPPGVTFQKYSSDTMEAEGEERSRGASRPVNVSPDDAAARGLKPAQPEQSGPR